MSSREGASIVHIEPADDSCVVLVDLDLICQLPIVSEVMRYW